MDHVAIDLGGRESQVCIRSSTGEVVKECRVKTSSVASLLRRRPASRVIVETCSEAFCVADAALEAGHEVRVVPATLVRSLGVGARRMKSDERDARVLSEVSTRIDLPSVHIPSKVSRTIKTLCGMRDALVSSRTQLINTVRGWMRAESLSPRTGKTETFVQRTRQRLAKQTIPRFVERQLEAIALLDQQIAEADQELEATAQSEPVCPRLMTVPGVGPVTALRFCAALDEYERFPSASHVQAYLGLTPGENSSSDRVQRTGITKAGPRALRACLIQAAWSARRSKGDHPMLAWVLEVEKRRGKKVAVVALARKISGILFALWRDGGVYDAQHVKPQLPASK